MLPTSTCSLVAASLAERMLLDGEPVPSVSDVEHTVKYASLVCRSPEAADRFVRLCEAMADDLLRPHGDLDRVVDTLAHQTYPEGRRNRQSHHKALAVEHHRRAE